MKAYHRDLALYALARAPGPMTAGDLLEVMGTLSQSEGHPRECWFGSALYPQAVVGILRALERDGLVERAGTVRNVDKGRDEPRWRASPPCNGYPLPEPPEEPRAGAAAPEPPEPDYSEFTRPELHTLLEYYDAQAAATTRFLRDVTDINERYRSRLIAMMGEG